MSRVLVIDDERPTLAMFELLLEAMGYDPVAADCGERGLELFREGDFPIVLTDIKMPGIDGMEVLSRIKASRPATEVIVITGHGDVELALAALNLKATDFIDKPISQEALANALRRAKERISRREHSKPSAVVREIEGIRVLDIAGNLSTDLEGVSENCPRPTAHPGFSSPYQSAPPSMERVYPVWLGSSRARVTRGLLWPLPAIRKMSAKCSRPQVSQNLPLYTITRKRVFVRF